MSVVQPPFWQLSRGRVPMHATAVLFSLNTTKAPVVSLADVKAQARVGIDVEDGLFASWTAAATTQVENDTGIKIPDQTWDIAADRFPDGDCITLPWGPLQKVTYLKYYDSAAALQTMPVADYILDTKSLPGRIGLAGDAVWPSDLRSFQPVSIRVVVGYAAVSSIPEPLLQAIRLVVSWHAMHREPTALELDSYDWLINPYRQEAVA